MQIVNYIIDSFNECYPFNYGLTLFSHGCNLHCKMCKGYNYEQVTDKKNIIGNAKDIIDKNITPLHDSVIFLGGEPTIWGDKLIECLKYCHDKGLKTKIFSNGMLPSIISKINKDKLCDAWSIDFKGLNNTKEEFGIELNHYLNNVMASIKDIQNNSLPLEIRTTFYDGNKEDELDIETFVYYDIIEPYKNKNPDLYIEYIKQYDVRNIV